MSYKKLHSSVRAVLLASLTVASVGFAFGSAQSGTSSAPQKSFPSFQAAAQALIQASADYDVPKLMAIFGPEGEDIISSSDPVRDKTLGQAFAADAQKKHSIHMDHKNPYRAILVVGDQEWPFPVPIVKKGSRWFFDTGAGRKEILYRRIGANELDAIQICRGFVEAQRQYAYEIHDNSGVNQYAQKIISTPGKQDGLFWRNADGSYGGPISEAIARAMEEGYSVDKRSAYHGYYFTVLKGQGPAAPLGTLDYVINGIMIGGFALIAAPAEYRVTGVKTFMVSNDGIVYQKDLGPDTLHIAKGIELYNPDKTWTPTKDQWPASVTASYALADSR